MLVFKEEGILEWKLRSMVCVFVEGRCVCVWYDLVFEDRVQEGVVWLFSRG